MLYKCGYRLPASPPVNILQSIIFYDKKFKLTYKWTRRLNLPQQQPQHCHIHLRYTGLKEGKSMLHSRAFSSHLLTNQWTTEKSLCTILLGITIFQHSMRKTLYVRNTHFWIVSCKNNSNTILFNICFFLISHICSIYVKVLWWWKHSIWRFWLIYTFWTTLNTKKWFSVCCLSACMYVCMHACMDVHLTSI
jgi:hypothetical protein